MNRVVAACVAAVLCMPLWTPLVAGEAAGGAGEDPASGEGPAEEAADERDLDAIIAEILDVDAVEEYDTTENCIARSRISRTEILNERFVVFHLRGDEKYLVQFRHRCPGLRRNGTMRLETRSFRICSMDTVQGLYEIGIGRGTWGPSCMIPGFEPVTREQVAIIKDELRRPR